MSSRRAAFAALHVPGRPFVLVNAWDVISALSLADAGHPAVGTTSLGITAAAGFADGAPAGRDRTVALARAVTPRLDVPLTVDLEDGYSDDPAAVADLVAELATCGVTGVNLEDSARTTAQHAAIIEAVREREPRIFLNARTDVFWSGSRDLDHALDRCRAYSDAGAHGLFVPGLDDPAGLGRVVALGLPVNALWQPGADLAGSGVARISTGSALYRHALGAALAAADAVRRGAPPTSVPVSYAETQRLLTAT